MKFPFALVVVDAFDEGASGLPGSGAYALVSAFAADVALLNGAIFVLPFLLSLFVDGPLLVFCERFRRESVLAAGLLGMALSMLGCALAPNLLWFGAAFAIFSPASGIACGVAQAALMDADPERREARMTEWATAGWIGDLCGPALIWASQSLGLGVRGAFATMACVLVAAAAALGRRRLGDGPDGDADEEDEVSLGESVALLARSPLLLAWLSGVALCSLLDEIVAVLIGLRVDGAGGGEALVATSLLAFTLGGVVGLLPLKAVLRRARPVTVLVAACIGSGIAYGAWLLAPTWLSPVLLFLTGLFTAAHYPLAQAQAYRALPERSTLVAAAGQPFVVVDLALPLLIGWVADAHGVLAAASLLALQPLGLAVVCGWARRSGQGPEPSDGRG